MTNFNNLIPSIWTKALNTQLRGTSILSKSLKSHYFPFYNTINHLIHALYQEGHLYFSNVDFVMYVPIAKLGYQHIQMDNTGVIPELKIKPIPVRITALSDGLCVAKPINSKKYIYQFLSDNVNIWYDGCFLREDNIEDLRVRFKFTNKEIQKLAMLQELVK